MSTLNLTLARLLPEHLSNPGPSIPLVFDFLYAVVDSVVQSYNFRFIGHIDFSFLIVTKLAMI